MVQVKSIQQVLDPIYLGERPERWPETGLKALMDDGWLAEGGDGLDFGPAGGAVVGLSAEREGVSWSVPGADHILEHGRIDADIQMQSDMSASESLLTEALAKAIKAAAVHLPQSNLAGVGMAWPAAIGRDGKPVIDPTLPKDGADPYAIRLTDPPRLLQAALVAAGFEDWWTGRSDGAIQVVNDADADLLYEARYGGARRARSGLGVKLCWGLGMAMLVHDQMARGHSCSAGEIQHIPVPWQDADSKGNSYIKSLAELDSCWCGEENCIARFATGKAIIDQFKRLDGSDSYNARGDKLRTDEKLRPVTQVFKRVGSLLGEALLGPVLALDPEWVTISAFPRHDALIQGLTEVLNPSNGVRVDLDKVVLATDDPDRTAAGAGRFVIEQYLLPKIESPYFSVAKRASRDALPLAVRVKVPAGKKPEECAPSY